MKKLIAIKLLLLTSFLFAQHQPYTFTNGSFESYNGVGGANFQTEAFTKLYLGRSWYAHTGEPKLIHESYNGIHGATPYGDRFACLNQTNYSNNRRGDSFFMYYPMKQGETYNLSYVYKTLGGQGNFYVIATNSASANFSNSSDSYIINNGGINNVLPLNDRQIVSNQSMSTNSNWTNRINVAFTANKNYTQLLFIPYLSNSGTARVYVDDVTMSGPLSGSSISLAINGKNSITNQYVYVCSEDDILMDASGTVDTEVDHNGNIEYFLAIYRKNSNGSFTELYKEWERGMPSFALIDLKSRAAFVAPQGQTTEYHVKLAINSGPQNIWIEKIQRVVVTGKPDFNFGVNFLASPGQTVTRKVKGLPSGNYAYKWYIGNNTGGNIISTSSQINITRGAAGSYTFTVEVTDLNTNCSAVKTTVVTYVDMDVLDPDLGELGFGKTANTKIKAVNTEIKVYPNPVSSILKIKSERDINRIEVYSFRGDKLLTSKSREINVSSLRKGMYVIKIYSNSTILSTQKFVKN